MKKSLLTLTIAMAISAGTLYAGESSSEQVHRPFFGFFLNNADFEYMTWGIAFQYFDNPELSMLEYNFGDGSSSSSTGVFAGAGIDGILYLCPYQYTSSLEAPKPTDMVSYNTYTGELKTIGPWNPDNANFKPTDMTYDYKTGTLYAIGYDYGSVLYKVDPETGSFTVVTELNDGSTIAAAPDGTLYTIANNGILYTINPQNGVLSKVFDTGISGMLSLQTMEFDRGNGKLYWASNCMSNDAQNIQLQEIDLSDPDNITISQIGRIGTNAVFMAMYIPAASSFDAPAAPSHVKAVTTDPNVLNATISWTNPITTFAEEPLDVINGVVLFRNGQQLALFTDPENTKPGASITFQDNTVPDNGEYRYDIIAFNSKGDGEKGSAFAYIGKDAPGAVNGISVKADNDFLGATIAWTAPTTGKHHGVFDSNEVKYRITRRPDNLVLANDLTETTWHDNSIRRLLNYWYDIEAYNEIGSTSALSGEQILGPAQSVPMVEDFEDSQMIPNRWKTVDANNDSFSWIFYSTMAHDIFGDYERGAEYILTPTSVDSRLKDADEWLISAPISFEADKDYELNIYARSYTYDYSPVKVELTVGPSTDYETMTKIGEADVDLPDLDPDTGSVALKKYSADLPAGLTLGCVAAHLVAPVPVQNMCFLQIGKIEVVEKEADGVADVICNDAPSFSINGKNLTISGNFSQACLYSADGRLICTLSGVNDLSGLASGIYLAKAGSACFKFAL